MAPTLKQVEARWKHIRTLFPEMAHLGYQGSTFMFGILTTDGGYMELDQAVGKQQAWDWMGAFLAGAARANYFWEQVHEKMALDNAEILKAAKAVRGED